MTEKRNGKIELFRFIFAIAVLFYHTVKWNCDPVSLSHGVHFAFFSKGNMGVDFFFILSGLLMAKTAFSREGTPIGKSEYGNFIWRKYKTVFPKHSVAFVFTLIFAILVGGSFIIRNILQLIIDNIPNFFLIMMTGIIIGDINGPMWYISSMLIGVAILYPFCRRWYYPFTRFFGPFIGLLILGYLEQTFGNITDMLLWDGFFFKGTIRGFADLMLGAGAFELSRAICNMRIANTKKGSIMILVCESGLLFVTLLFMVLTLPQNYQVYEVILFFFLVSLAFSGKAYGSNIFNTKASYVLGQFSLSLYVSQKAGYYLVCLIPADFSPQVHCILTVVMTFLLAMIITKLAKPVEKAIIKLEKTLGEKVSTN